MVSQWIVFWLLAPNRGESSRSGLAVGLWEKKGNGTSSVDDFPIKSMNLPAFSVHFQWNFLGTSRNIGIFRRVRLHHGLELHLAERTQDGVGEERDSFSHFVVCCRASRISNAIRVPDSRSLLLWLWLWSLLLLLMMVVMRMRRTKARCGIFGVPLLCTIVNTFGCAKIVPYVRRHSGGVFAFFEGHFGIPSKVARTYRR